MPARLVTTCYSCQTSLRWFQNGGGVSDEFYDAGWCTGWVSGVSQLTLLHNEWTSVVKGKPTLLQFCLPASGVPLIQEVRVIVKYLADHPEQLHEDGMALTIAALRSAFPCK